jgi:hypothetical protein
MRYFPSSRRCYIVYREFPCCLVGGRSDCLAVVVCLVKISQKGDLYYFILQKVTIRLFDELYFYKIDKIMCHVRWKLYWADSDQN